MCVIEACIESLFGLNVVLKNQMKVGYVSFDCFLTQINYWTWVLWYTVHIKIERQLLVKTIKNLQKKNKLYNINQNEF